MSDFINQQFELAAEWYLSAAKGTPFALQRRRLDEFPSQWEDAEAGSVLYFAKYEYRRKPTDEIFAWTLERLKGPRFLFGNPWIRSKKQYGEHFRFNRICQNEKGTKISWGNGWVTMQELASEYEYSYDLVNWFPCRDQPQKEAA